MSAHAGLDADVPQHGEIVAALQHVHTGCPVSHDCAANALFTLFRVRGEHHPVRQVAMPGPARRRLRLVVVLLIRHVQLTFGEAPAAEPILNRLHVEDGSHREPDRHRAVLGK